MMQIYSLQGNIWVKLPIFDQIIVKQGQKRDFDAVFEAEKY